MNTKKTSKLVASKAVKVPSSPNASKVLQSDKYRDDTKEFAASVLAQSNKKR
ncbi:TPA: hypothetical protein P0E33_004331 [Vibrio harveyi]|nr:hypothetical protein [Vibrio harveyi]HDM8182373.1 hypothetical protein [Vibrio harveyi]